MVYIYVALAAYNTGQLTLGMGEVGCLVDEAAHVAVVDGEGRIVRRSYREVAEVGGKEQRSGRGDRVKGSPKVNSGGRRMEWVIGDGGEGVEDGQKELDWRTLWTEGTDAVMDVPIGGVCEVLYGQG